jgi:HSP20 family protein
LQLRKTFYTEGMLKNKPTSIPISDNTEARLSLLNDFSDSGWTTLDGELALDVFVTDKQVVVRAPMAGVKPDDINVSLHNDLLTIRGHREEKRVPRQAKFVVQECHWGDFSRSVVLPVEVEIDKTEALLEDGVLFVALERAEPRIVKINVKENADS